MSTVETGATNLLPPAHVSVSVCARARACVCACVCACVRVVTYMRHKGYAALYDHMLEQSRRVVFFFNRILGVSRFFASGRSSATLPGVSFGGVRQYGRPVRGAVVQHTSISMLCSNRSETFVFWWFAMLSCDIFWYAFLCDEFKAVRQGA